LVQTAILTHYTKISFQH